jgi:protein-S-isoprenylcysteine O-methyltransferase Ste14
MGTSESGQHRKESPPTIVQPYRGAYVFLLDERKKPRREPQLRPRIGESWPVSSVARCLRRQSEEYMLKAVSIVGYLAMFAAVLGLLASGSLLATEPIAIAVQAIAVAIMVWARLVFGRRSFHVSADPTAGGLVTTGPYGYIRHPIYTAVCLFVWAGIFAHCSLISIIFGVLLSLGIFARMVCEERLLAQRYPEYVDYAQSTKRMIPHVF